MILTFVFICIQVKICYRIERVENKLPEAERGRSAIELKDRFNTHSIRYAFITLKICYRIERVVWDFVEDEDLW